MTRQTVDMLIIRPTDRKNIYGQLDKSTSAIEPPLWAALLAAYVRREGFSVGVIDVEAENLNPDQAAAKAASLTPELAAFVVTGNNLSASTWHMTGTREYITALKQRSPQTKTLLWGLHPSALPERTLHEEGTDFICQGEGFVTLTELLELLKSGDRPDGKDIPGLWYFENGRVNANPRAELINDLDDLPSPAWDLLPMEKYRAHNWHCMHDLTGRRPYGVLYTSLGCPFDCSFCSLKALFGKPGVRFRSPQKVIEDIDVLVRDHGIRNIKVLDECFVLKQSHVLAICDLIIERGYDLNMWAYARVNTVNEKLLARLKQAGVNWLCYGIESADSSVLDGVEKHGFDINDTRRTIRMTRDAGINILANFMFGLPDDNEETMRKTLDLAKELNCEYTNFSATKAYPGSDLYGQALSDGVKLPETWRGYSEFSEDCLPLPTKYLSGEDVLRFRDDAWTEFHSNPQYLEMISEKFSSSAADHIRNVLSCKLPRKYLKQVQK